MIVLHCSDNNDCCSLPSLEQLLLLYAVPQASDKQAKVIRKRTHNVVQKTCYVCTTVSTRLIIYEHYSQSGPVHHESWDTLPQSTACTMPTFTAQYSSVQYCIVMPFSRAVIRDREVILQGNCKRYIPLYCFLF